jgi:Tfp pilus assembly protein PilE
MKLLKIIGLILVTFTLFSCSNSANKYHASNFERVEFNSANENTIKKSFASDYHLMASLLNRPMTADQAMMLAFSKQSQTQNKTTAFVNFVSIRGDKLLENQSSDKTDQYSTLIANDINAVTISGSL